MATKSLNFWLSLDHWLVFIGPETCFPVSKIDNFKEWYLVKNVFQTALTEARAITHV